MQTDEESKESVLEGVLKLFFKIGIHNRCKVFMDEYRNKKHVLQKQKKPLNESEKIWKEQQSKTNMTSNQNFLALFIFLD